jgi:mono/diheme cytochrome c family protein
MFTAGRSRIVLVLLLVLVLAGCRTNMRDQPKLDDPYQQSPNFGVAAREALPEAVPVGALAEDEGYNTGLVDGQFITEIPVEVNAEMLAEGRHDYEAFCSPCHGYDGYGQGVVSLEGFPQAPSLHTDANRTKAVGEFFAVITMGQGNMYSYAARVPVEDRWGVVAYMRALQLSQYAPADSLPVEALAEVEVGPALDEALPPAPIPIPGMTAMPETTPDAPESTPEAGQ